MKTTLETALQMDALHRNSSLQFDDGSGFGNGNKESVHSNVSEGPITQGG